MAKHRTGRSVACLVAAAFCAAAAAAETQAEYYKAGDMGVFAGTVALPADVDLGTTVLTAQPEDEKTHLLYVDLPLSVLERVTAAHRQEAPRLTPQQQAKADALDKEHAELYGRWVIAPIYKHEEQIRALTTLIAQEERNKEVRDDGFLARARQRLAELEGANKKLQEEWERAGPERQKFYNRMSEIHREKEQILVEARKQGRDAAAAAPVRILGRFEGTGKARVAVLARSTEELLAELRPVAILELDLPAADGGKPELLKDWALAQARDFALRVADSPYSSYYQYCLLQSVKKYSVPEDDLPPRLRRAAVERRRPDLYSIATGGLAIQESLQLDAMTRREQIPDDRGIALDALKGPDIKSHPFDKMLAGRTPKLDPVAALVPFDAYYAHFTSISKEIATSDLLSEWGASLVRFVSLSARDADVAAKYQEQLCIGVSALTRLFGDLVIGEIAATGNDPFLIEGTDLTVLIQVKNRAVFDKQMKAYLDAALAAHPDAKTETTDYQGVPILSVTTPDRAVSSHSAYLGDTKVYSNSLDALKRVIDTQAKRRPSMADNLDFQYMRTVFPAAPEAEDGFIYLSDAFIRKLVGPRWKVEAQRRIICQNHLRMIANAATMSRTELRKKPTLAALAKEGYLPDPLLKCPDGGTYSLDDSGRAFCSVHNCLRTCTPVDGVALDRVSKAEADDYKRFVENYNSYWRQYFDPIGIRFKVGDRIELETCILPLIENSAYNQVRELVGGKPVALRARALTDRTILSVAAKLDLTDPHYKKMVEEMRAALFPTIPPITNAVGSSFSLGLCDSDVLFTVDERGMQMMGGWMDLETQLTVATFLSALNLPVYGVLELKDEKLAQTMVRELVRVACAGQRLEEGADREDFFGMDAYDAGEHNGHPVQALTLRLAVIKFRLYYAIARQRLIIATKRYVLDEVLDALDKGKAGDDAVGNVLVTVRPKAYDKLLPVTTAGWQESMREACLKNLVPIRALIECHGATEATLEGTSRRVEGTIPRCPAGGAYQYDPRRDIVYCTLHGDRMHPRQPAEPTGKEGLVKFLRRLRDFSIAFRFTDEGIMTKLAFDLEPLKE